MSTHHLVFQEIDAQYRSEYTFFQESADSDLHVIGVVGLESDSSPKSSESESIFHALQDDTTSDAGSRSTVQVNIDTDSDDGCVSMFGAKVKGCFGATKLPPSEVAAGSFATIHQAFMANLTEMDAAVATLASAEAAKDDDLQEELGGRTNANSQQPPPTPKKKTFKRREQSELRGTFHEEDISMVNQILNTPVNEETNPESLKKLHLSMLNRSKYLKEKEGGVINMIK